MAEPRGAFEEPGQQREGEPSRGRSSLWKRLVVRSLRAANAGSAAGATEVERRQVQIVNEMSAIAFVIVIGFGISYLLLDARNLWPLGLGALAIAPGFLAPIALERSGYRGYAPHALFLWMTATLTVFPVLLVGRAAGLHAFLLIAGIVPLVLWPARRGLLAIYFLVNLAAYLVVELVALPRPLVALSAPVLAGLRAACLLLTLASVTAIVAGQAWFAERHRLQLVVRSAELRKANALLEESLARVRTLEGIIPICAYCKSMRNDRGYWEQVERYISERTDAAFTHGICPSCTSQHFPGLE